MKAASSNSLFSTQQNRPFTFHSTEARRVNGNTFKSNQPI